MIRWRIRSAECQSDEHKHDQNHRDDRGWPELLVFLIGYHAEGDDREVMPKADQPRCSLPMRFVTTVSAQVAEEEMIFRMSRSQIEETRSAYLSNPTAGAMKKRSWKEEIPVLSR